MSEKFKMPQTREEAVARKEALLEKINKYNEDYFNGVTTLTEEEIKLAQEEYQFLDEVVEIEADYVVIEEEKEKNFFDKVSIWVWIYAIFAFFSGLYIIQQAVGFEVFSLVYNWEWLYDVSNTVLWLGLVGCYLAYPVLLIALSLVLKFTVFKKSLENKKAFNYVLLGQGIFLLINFLISYYQVIDMVYQMLKN